MDAIISKILEIEKRACEIVREAEERKLDIAGIIEDEKQVLLQSSMQQTEQKIEAEHLKIIKNAEAEAKQHAVRAEEKIAVMNGYRESHLDEWVKTLYERIVGSH